ncbi:MAG: ClbS/DfsB family four-helix bundle protein [Ignavibacteriaceae bacterium]|nr:ClbS/DfsB family four-helix bundle protein [Ignavibacteriaceae bacterium]
MPRPTTKEELIDLSRKNFDKLNTFIDSLSPAQQISEFPKGTMNRNVRDVLAHLHHWHLLMAGWYESGMKGGKPDMPAKGYTWKTLPELNLKIWEEYSGAELKKVRKLFEKSYGDIRELIVKHTNDELFEKKKYKWTGTTSLGAYFVSSTSSHYDWALKLITRAFKVK